ncbi:MAG: hypothetical protein ABL958_20600, partial [Bdellovibrionia bacterium]
MPNLILQSVLVLFLIPTLANAAEEPTFVRGSLLLSALPNEAAPFLEPSANGSFKAKLSRVREACHVLTDRNITQHRGITLAKKKKAISRHTKLVCEEIERSLDENRVLTVFELDRVIELLLLENSFLERSKADARGVTLTDKLRMFIADATSDLWLSVSRDNPKSREAANWGQDKLNALSGKQISELDPSASPFWQSPGAQPEKRFDNLAKAKKTKFKGGILLFTEVSADGSSPKITARETTGEDEWSIKWGDEVHTDIIGSRLFAALGYDVDHPYFASGEDFILIFSEPSLPVHDNESLLHAISEKYKISLKPWIHSAGAVTPEMIDKRPLLSPYKGKAFVRFKESAIEGRPDKVKRLGPFGSAFAGNSRRRELRGSVIPHLWIGNWDTREENTLLTTVNVGDLRYRLSGIFSDLGTSLGVRVNVLPPDFRVGLPNSFSWNLVEASLPGSVRFNAHINSLSKPFAQATYADMRWAVRLLAQVKAPAIQAALKASGLPPEIQTIYFHKLASRRAQLLKAFEVADPQPIPFDRRLRIERGGFVVVENGELLKELDTASHPEG